MNNIQNILLIILFVTFLSIDISASENKQLPTPAASQTNEQINWFVVASGGNTQSSSIGYGLAVTVGQPFVGKTSSSNYNLNLGFWQNFISGNCCVNRGNVDGVIGPFSPVDVADLTYLVAFLWQGGVDPPCMEEANVDGVMGPFGPVDVADITYLVAFLWEGGAPPPPCP